MRPRELFLAFGITLAAALSIVSCSDDEDDDDGRFELVEIGGDDGKIYDYEFARRKYFFLWDPDTASAFDPERYEIRGEDLAVFLNSNNNEADRRQGKELIDSALVSVSGSPETVHFREQFYRLTPNDDYYFVNSEWSANPILILRTALSPEWTMAVSYLVTERGTGVVVDTVGTYVDVDRGAGDAIWLKMIYAPNRERPNLNLHSGPWAPTRRLELRNVYNLGVGSIDPGSLDLSIHFDSGLHPAELDDVPYLEVLGLDLLNNETLLSREDSRTGGKGPDGLVDPRFIDYENGLLYFPDLRPFDPSSIDLNGNDPEDPLDGSRSPSRERPRLRALGHERVMANGGEGSPLYGFRYVRLSPAAVVTETNGPIYDHRDLQERFRKYYLTGTIWRYLEGTNRRIVN